MPVRDVEVELYFLRTEDGGRSAPAFSGYRPQFYYLGQDCDAQHEYPDVERVMPGDLVRAYLWFAAPAFHVGRVSEGMPFLIREGARTVAYGVVRKLVDLEESARRSRD
jgi:translation elongation factor EF-Tu-like GTPase